MKEIKVTCDLCGKKIEENEGIFFLKTYKVGRFHKDILTEINDVCLDCYIEIINNVTARRKQNDSKGT